MNRRLPRRRALVLVAVPAMLVVAAIVVDRWLPPSTPAGSESAATVGADDEVITGDSNPERVEGATDSTPDDVAPVLEGPVLEAPVPDENELGTESDRRDVAPGRTECQDWVGRDWLMTVYSVPVDHPDTRTVAELAEEGFTHLGPWYEDDRWQSGPEAARLGLCTVFPVGRSMSVDEALTDIESTVAAVRSDLERALADPLLDESISMWSLLPEEANIYRPGHLELLERLTEEVHRIDPLKRPIYSYLQSNADERQFETASLYLGVLGHGNYLSTDGRADQRVYLRASIDRALAAREAMGEPDDAVMPVIEHRIHRGVLPPGQSTLIESWVRHDVYTTFAAGADGFIAFSGFPPDRGLDDFDRYNDAYTEVVADVVAAGLPDLYRNGTIDPSVTATVIAGPAELEIPVLFVPQRGNPTEIYPSVTVRAWRWQGRHTAVVVNHADEAVTVEISGDQLETRLVELEPIGVAVVSP